MKLYLSYVIIVLVSLATCGTARAEALGNVALEQAMLDLGNDFRMMCVAAHPDDEDGATLAYYRMLHGVKTIAVIATRGEGGQNEIGPELYNELGVIRTREMKAAAAIEGAELHFLDLPEFGFSKTAEEALEIWGKETALERTVRVIRETRPHVIITNHGRMKDHGQHQAIGAVLQEAFDAAADPSRFPEHAKEGLAPWQATRLYIRDFRGDKGTTRTNISAMEPIRGKTISEIAASALDVHKSQGMGYFIDLLLSTRHETYYQLVKTKQSPKTSSATASKEYGALFDGIPLPAAPLSFERASKTATRAALYTWLADNAALRGGTLDEQERWSEVNRAAIIASDLRLIATTKDPLVTPGQKVELTVKLADFGEPNALMADITLSQRHGLGEIGNHRLQIPFQTEREGEGAFSFVIPVDAVRTIPLAPRLFTEHFLEPQLEVQASVNCGDATLELSAPVYLDVAEPLTIDFPGAPVLVLADSGGPISVDALVTNYAPEAFSEYVELTPPEGWSVQPERMSVSLSKEGEQRIVSFMLTPPGDLATGDYVAHAHIPGAPGQVELNLRVAQVQLPHERRTGLIQGYDTTFATTLEKLGLPYDLIGVADYRPERLDVFDTIIVDIRAYQYRPDLVANNSALLDYVQRGGTLLVMYQKTFDWNPDFAPAPITLSTNRVTREEAPMTILVPEHPLFNTPNVIQNADWDGWIQERGLYFPESWGEAFTPLVKTTDPNEDIPPGSYLVMDHGEGHYIYTALSWYRQLRALHPGALKCFANMLAL